jgi:hypothetical protein
MAHFFFVTDASENLTRVFIPEKPFRVGLKFESLTNNQVLPQGQANFKLSQNGFPGTNA